MIRRRNSSGLRRAGNGRYEEDVNPNAHITNLADCMLVVVLGLVVALIARYNIMQQTPEDQITGIEMNMDADQDGQIDSNYTETGTVYQDPTTGKYYLVQE